MSNVKEEFLKNKTMYSLLLEEFKSSDLQETKGNVKFEEVNLKNLYGDFYFERTIKNSFKYTYLKVMHKKNKLTLTWYLNKKEKPFIVTFKNYVNDPILLHFIYELSPIIDIDATSGGSVQNEILDLIFNKSKSIEENISADSINSIRNLFTSFIKDDLINRYNGSSEFKVLKKMNKKFLYFEFIYFLLGEEGRYESFITNIIGEDVDNIRNYFRAITTPGNFILFNTVKLNSISEKFNKSSINKFKATKYDDRFDKTLEFIKTNEEIIKFISPLDNVNDFESFCIKNLLIDSFVDEELNIKSLTNNSEDLNKEIYSEINNLEYVKLMYNITTNINLRTTQMILKIK